jgi:hypothetical protein
MTNDESENMSTQQDADDSTETRETDPRRNLKIGPDVYQELAAGKGTRTWDGYLRELKRKADVLDDMQGGEAGPSGDEPVGVTVETRLQDDDRRLLESLRDGEGDSEGEGGSEE